MASSGTPTSHSKDKGKGKQGQMQHQLDQINGVEGESVGGGEFWATLPTFPDEPWAGGFIAAGAVGKLGLAVAPADPHSDRVNRAALHTQGEILCADCLQILHTHTHTQMYIYIYIYKH